MILEQLRVTLLSLKQISDRLKLLNTTSVTKSEALAYKNEIIEALNSIDDKIDDISTELNNVAKEEHNLLVANNKMLQDIINYIAELKATKDEGDLKEFLSNVVADMIVTKRFGH